MCSAYDTYTPYVTSNAKAVVGKSDQIGNYEIISELAILELNPLQLPVVIMINDNVLNNRVYSMESRGVGIKKNDITVKGVRSTIFMSVMCLTSGPRCVDTMTYRLHSLL